MVPLPPYGLLWLAIATEIVATSALKASDGFSKLGYTAVVIVGYVVSFYLVGQALKELEVGTVYAIWSGAGTAAVAVIGVVVFKESLDLVKMAGIALVVVGVVLLNLTGGH